MSEASKNQEIFVIDEVVAELERKDDDVHKWVKQREAMIVAIDEQIQSCLAKLMSKYPRLVDSKKNRSGGDPWVIALAQARSWTVVTAEKPSGNLTKPKIPDVCKDLSIPCIEVVEFFRRQGWKW